MGTAEVISPFAVVSAIVVPFVFTVTRRVLVSRSAVKTAVCVAGLHVGSK
ncbi:hypothetical protein ACFZDK_23280 [Streptomyces sp. NPDC007901]